MSNSERTTLQRIAPEVVDALADDVVVLNDIAVDGTHGGGDVDCAIRGFRPYWHLRLKEWRVCQALRYDVTACYFVLARGTETLALDVLDDPDGIGKYGIRTSTLSPADHRGGYAQPHDRAAYLTVKRIVKGEASQDEWDEIRALAGQSRGAFRVRLADAVGTKLATEIIRELDAGRSPSTETLVATRAHLRRRRNVSFAHLRRSVARVAGRLARPTGLVVLLVGPDGVGKSSVGAALPEACGQLFRRSLGIHFRPAVLPRPGSLARRPDRLDSSRPHARVPHGRLLSVALLAYHWMDALLGHAVRVWPVRTRTGLVVVERGFVDIAVDPRRYRLRVSPTLVDTLARLLPRPDVTIILEAPPETITARKSELSATEVQRQLAAWDARAHSAVRLDVSRPLEEVVDGARDAVMAALEQRALVRLDGGWAAIPFSRLWIPRRRAAALGALRVQEASKATSRLALQLTRLGIAAGGTRLLRASAPPEEVRLALAEHLPPGCTYGVKRSIHPGRFLAPILDSTGRPVALAKIATDELSRARLRAERLAIERWGPFLPTLLTVPYVRAASDDVLVVDWIPNHGRRQPWRLQPEVAAALGSFFAAGRTNLDELRGPAHGDCAPWNLLSLDVGWALVDWEVSLEDAPAFFDPFHYIVQAHAFLGRPSSSEILRGLEGEGWIGDALDAYSLAAGVPRESARECFAEYLRYTSSPATRRDMGELSLAVRRALLASVIT